MQYLNVLTRAGFWLSALLFCNISVAETVEFDGQKFIEAASIRAISEVETAKVSLQKSASPAVQKYAQTMIAENTARLNELRKVAGENQLSMLSDAELQAKARKYVFERNGQSFDEAYAGMRAVERRKIVNLYRQAINSDHEAIKRYAAATLPELMHQLYMAQELVQTIKNPESEL